MADYSDWLGRETRRIETISDRQVAHFRAALAGTLGPGTLEPGIPGPGTLGPDAVPPGFHWCLMPDAAAPGDLGRDGHPRPGLVMPALPLPRRMWAGGELDIAAPLHSGETVNKFSRIADITFKSGSTGALGFVTVRNVWSVGGQTRLTERQDIVYRDDPKPDPAPSLTPSPAPAEDWPAAQIWRLTPDTVLLFRYSALTFNGHRIHYDHPYATGVEGYGGLVVHGPLQATWMLNLASKVLGRLPANFRYRGLAPLICGQPVRIEACEGADGLRLRVCRADGVATMQASARL